LSTLQSDLFRTFNASNSLYPGVFPSVRKFEAEVTEMIVQLVKGKVGLLTSGGTESILLAVLAYRNSARANKGITEPEIVCSTSRHGALDKACKYFGVKLVKTEPTGDQR
jgi:sphinganine-1-phosphate aldolase